MPTGAELTMLQGAIQNSNNPIIQGVTQAPQVGMGMLLGKYQDKRQFKQAEKLQNLQIAGQKQLTDYNLLKQLEMFEKTGYGAQKSQMERAGLNPALLYGMSGGGGQSTNVATGNVSGQGAAQGGGIESMIGMGIQLGMMQSQKALLDAQTRKTNVEADKTAGVDTTLVKAQTASLTQGISNQKAQEDLTRAETRLKKLDEQLKGETMDDMIDLASWTTLKAQEDLHQASNETFISQATKNAKVDIIKTEAVAAVLRNYLTQAQTAKTHSDIQVNNQTLQNLAQKIVQDWRALELKGGELSNEQRQTQIAQSAQDLQELKMPIEIVEKIIQGIILRNIITPQGGAPIRGFHNR